MSFKVTPQSIPDVLHIEPIVFPDDRGYFKESYNLNAFEEFLPNVKFVQDNESKSTRGVVRGLHYQKPPHEQGKLVRVVRGKVFDVAVDINPNSTTYCQWISVELSACNCRQLWVPPGYAHGFFVLSDSAIVLYKATAYHSSGNEVSVPWREPRFSINWPLAQDALPIISKKDAR